jgi:hypothetical protein
VPIKVKLAYSLLTLGVLFVVGMLGFAALQEPEIRVLLGIFALAGFLFWAIVTVEEWRYDERRKR